MQYQLTVIWDQKDLGFRSEVLKQFEEEINLLFAEGMKVADTLDTLTTLAADPQTVRDLNNLKEYAKTHSLKQKQIIEIIVQFALNSGHTGETWLLITATVAIAPVLASRFKGIAP